MRLDSKYFNRFLVICAVLTALVIVYSTLRYVSNRQETFREETKNATLSDWTMYHFASGDSVTVDRYEGSPVVVHFWSTWSDLSMDINQLLNEVKQENPQLVVVAAAARDADELVIEYMNNHNYDFEYINGTPLYQDLMVPGIPAQLFVNERGVIEGQNVGKDAEAIRNELFKLLDR
ncbi:MAG: hypothetical protein R6V27_16265 [Balneolaceae bacterium]